MAPAGQGLWVEATVLTSGTPVCACAAEAADRRLGRDQVRELRLVRLVPPRPGVRGGCHNTHECARHGGVTRWRPAQAIPARGAPWRTLSQNDYSTRAATRTQGRDRLTHVCCTQGHAEGEGEGAQGLFRFLCCDRLNLPPVATILSLCAPSRDRGAEALGRKRRGL